MQVNVTKIILYVVLALLATYCGRQFVGRYSLLMSSDINTDPIAMMDSTPVAPASTNGVAGTNVTGVVTAGDHPSGPAVVAPPSDEGGAKTNAASPSGGEPGPRTAIPAPKPARARTLTVRGLERPDAPDTSGIALYAVALFAVLIGLGILAAHDISSFLGQKAHKLLQNEEGEGMHSVDYDSAEEVWANGDYLEAIRLMREYLQKNPREVHVMARIAEIYEKDLGNYLAAALEYEEFLKHKLPPERWGWAAIHLVNLYYGRLDKPEQGLALLWKIHREYGNTQAAAKARKRLNQIDPTFAAEQARLDREAAEAAAAAAEESTGDPETPDAATAGEDLEEEPLAPAWEAPAEDPESNLPRGFRPKKH